MNCAQFKRSGGGKSHKGETFSRLAHEPPEEPSLGITEQLRTKKSKQGIPSPPAPGSKRWRRRAGPTLWFEAILTHGVASSCFPSGKSDRVQPYGRLRPNSPFYTRQPINILRGETQRVSHASGRPTSVFATNVHLEVFVPF